MGDDKYDERQLQKRLRAEAIRLSLANKRRRERYRLFEYVTGEVPLDEELVHYRDMLAAVGPAAAAQGIAKFRSLHFPHVDIQVPIDVGPEVREEAYRLLAQTVPRCHWLITNLPGQVGVLRNPQRVRIPWREVWSDSLAESLAYIDVIGVSNSEHVRFEADDFPDEPMLSMTFAGLAALEFADKSPILRKYIAYPEDGLIEYWPNPFRMLENQAKDGSDPDRTQWEEGESKDIDDKHRYGVPRLRNGTFKVYYEKR
ncbi:MAG: hypothetical protein Q4G21_03205 [Dermabacter sp.]|nr:hypothetical protein [Dermabacter sp.]